VFKIINGEIIITEVDHMDDEGNYVVLYPAVIVPIPPQQAGGQQNQIGFGKFMPFSDYSKDIILNPKGILVDSDPNKQMIDAYENWLQQVRQMESGIITAKPADIPPQGSKAGNITNFRGRLNT
jgi:hypothetical protein